MKVAPPAALDPMQLRAELRFKFNFAFNNKTKNLRERPQQAKTRILGRLFTLRIWLTTVIQLVTEIVIALVVLKAISLFEYRISGTAVVLILVVLMIVKIMQRVHSESN